MSRDDVLYTGVDVVPELVAHNAATFGARLPRVRFLLADVVTDRALQAGYDLIFSRDMLQVRLALCYSRLSPSVFSSTRISPSWYVYLHIQLSLLVVFSV